MPRARVQSTASIQKPKAAHRINIEMQTQTHAQVTMEGIAALKVNMEFDLWLQRELGRLHGDALIEPVPDRLLRIIEDASRSPD